MGVSCDGCGEYHDHNIMTHIWKMEAEIEELKEKVAELTPEPPATTSAGGGKGFEYTT